MLSAQAHSIHSSISMRTCISRAARAARQCARLASSPLQPAAASSSTGGMALRSTQLMAARGETQQARRLSAAAAAASRSPAASAAAAEVAEPAAAEASTSYGAQQIQVTTVLLPGGVAGRACSRLQLPATSDRPSLCRCSAGSGHRRLIHPVRCLLSSYALFAKIVCPVC